MNQDAARLVTGILLVGMGYIVGFILGTLCTCAFIEEEQDDDDNQGTSEP